MTFGEKLYKLRKEQNLSQEALAEKVNATRQAVSRWENGQGFPETEKLLILSSLFQVSLDYLLKDTPPEEAEGSPAEEGYYASRETTLGYLAHTQKTAVKIGLFVLCFFGAALPFILFPHVDENICALGSIIFIAAGIAGAISMAFQTDPYPQMEKEPLFFDHQFLEELKARYGVLRKRYVWLFIFGFLLIFLAGGFAILFDDILGKFSMLSELIALACVSGSIFCWIFSIGMMSAYEILLENPKHIASRRKWQQPAYRLLAGVLIGLGVIVFIALYILWEMNIL